MLPNDQSLEINSALVTSKNKKQKNSSFPAFQFFASPPNWQRSDGYEQEWHRVRQMLLSMRRKHRSPKLRIFVKPQMCFPMSMGVYGLLAFSFFSGTTAVIQAAKDGILGHWWGARLLAALPQKLISMPGSLFAVFLGGYTGVLLTATSVPLWSRSKLLGGIFISSAISTSTALISFVLRLIDAPDKTLHKLEKMEWTGMLIEGTGLLAFLHGSGRAARPLVGTAPGEHGMTFWRFMFGGGLVLPWLLQTFMLFRKSTGKPNKGGLVVSLLVLVGGYFLRRTMIEAGRTSSLDARGTLWNARR